MNKSVTFTALLTISVLLSGCIRFGPVNSFDASSADDVLARGSVLADVTGNGRADAVVLTTESLVRMEPCGTGCLQPAETIEVGNRYGIVAGDFNEDGHFDVVVGTDVPFGSPEPARIFFGSADGLDVNNSSEIDATDTFGFLASPIGVGDFNGDGHSDLLLRALDIAYLEGDGAGGFGPMTVLASYPSARSSVNAVRTGDIDGNGDDEVLIDLTALIPNTVIHQLIVLLAESSLSVPDPPFTLTATGDIDGDGRDDVIGRNGTEIHLLRSTGTNLVPFPGDRKLLASGAVGPTHVADLNNDGNNDIVSIAGSRLTWWNGGGNGGFYDPYGLPRLDIAMPSTPSSLAIGDTDGDGRDDLVVIDQNSAAAEVTLVANDSLTLENSAPEAR